MTLSAAAETAPAPSVEEILNEYHSKAFAAQNGGVSTYARSGKTLEQETVEELTAAGYEAYNVTADNYEALQETLKTDFADMGLDPEGSYIIVISGEEKGGNSNANSRVAPLPEYDHIGEGSGKPDYFTRMYRGVAYNLRYATVTAAQSDSLRKSGLYTLQNQYWLNYVASNLFSTILVAFADAVTPKYLLGTIGSIIFDVPNDNVSVDVVLDSLSVHAEVGWTCEYIQIWDSNEWKPVQYSEYATAMAYCAGTGYDYEANRPIPIIHDPFYFTSYSLYFNDIEARIAYAFDAFDYGRISIDTVSYVEFYFGNQEGEVVIDSDGEPLLKLTRSTTVVLPN